MNSIKTNVYIIICIQLIPHFEILKINGSVSVNGAFYVVSTYKIYEHRKSNKNI